MSGRRGSPRLGSWRASPEIESSHGFLVPLPLQLALIYSSLCHRALICISRESHGSEIVIVRPELETDDEESYVTGGWWWIFGDEVPSPTLGGDWSDDARPLEAGLSRARQVSRSRGRDGIAAPAAQAPAGEGGSARVDFGRGAFRGICGAPGGRLASGPSPGPSGRSATRTHQCTGGASSVSRRVASAHARRLRLYMPQNTSQRGNPLSSRVTS
jgi:hypothetical protein